MCSFVNYQQNQKTMISIEAHTISTAKLHGYLLGAIAPRPIAFASTVDAEGNVNLSPYSFFNVFGSNPPILVFSPSRRVRDNTIKHTLENIREVPEVVINIANYPMVEQMSLSSTEYDKGVNEFIKAGFTEAESMCVRPPRVAEAPAAFECKVKQIIETGQEGGAGNLVICEVLVVHLQENILDEAGHIDPFKLDAISRMGGNWYCRAQGDAIFEVAKPNSQKGIGVDNIPDEIRLSKVLTGNDLGKLGNIHTLPSQEEVKAFRENTDVKGVLEAHSINSTERLNALHKLAQTLLHENQVIEAWKVLLQNQIQ